MDNLIFFFLAAAGILMVAIVGTVDQAPVLKPVIICAFTGPSDLPCHHE